MRKLLATPLVSALVGGTVVAAALLGFGVVDRSRTTTIYQSPLATATASRADTARTDTLTAGDIYRRDAPGVAFVRARTLAPTSSPFDVYGGGGSEESTGSGFVLDRKGHVLTNAHVVNDAVAVTVTFGGKHATEARIVGKDNSTDLAVLKVDPKGLDLRPLELGDSSGIEVGDPTVAIGNPFGFDRTLTTGVVSALQRRISAPDGYTIENVIQTDAAINPGNSGGPLIDAAGRVIGINSQIATGGNGSGSVGIGFAIPIDTAKAVIAELKAHGRVQRPWLGVAFVPVDASMRELGVDVSSGLLVQSVRRGGPAARAGIVGGHRLVQLPTGDQLAVGGDVVTAIDGRPTRGADDVRRALESHKPGDGIAVRLTRGGKERTVEVTLGNRPAGGADS